MHTGRVCAALVSVELLVGPIEVELDAQQHDAAIGDELSDDHRCCGEGATHHQDPIVGSVGVRDWKRVEVVNEFIDDRRQVMTMESVLDGSPFGPRSLPSCRSRSSKNAWSTRTARRLVTVRVWRCLDSQRCARRSCVESVPEALAKLC